MVMRFRSNLDFGDGRLRGQQRADQDEVFHAGDCSTAETRALTPLSPEFVFARLSLLAPHRRKYRIR
jgi:hypothetical protein